MYLPNQEIKCYFTTQNIVALTTKSHLLTAIVGEFNPAHTLTKISSNLIASSASKSQERSP
jgi:hypothetical protein